MIDSDSDDIKDLIDARYDGLKQINEFVKSQVLNIVLNQLNLNKQEKCILGTFLRVHSLIDSLLRLNEISDYDSISIISRTIFELNVDIKLLSSSDAIEEMFDRFISFPKIDRYRKAKQSIKLEAINPELKKLSVLGSKKREEFLERIKQLNSIDQETIKLWGRNKNDQPKWPSHWSGKNLLERIKPLGLETEYQYRELFAFLSSYVHSGSSSYAGFFSEESLKAVYGTSIEFARIQYLESVIICCRHFKLDEVTSDFVDKMNELESAPDAILMKYYLNRKL